jgi:hypothetical protein
MQSPYTYDLTDVGKASLVKPIKVTIKTVIENFYIYKILNLLYLEIILYKILDNVSNLKELNFKIVIKSL